MGMFGNMWKEAEASAARTIARRGTKRVASTTARSSGGRGFRGRALRVGLGAGAVGGAYAMGRSSGARANSMVPPSTGIYGV